MSKAGGKNGGGKGVYFNTASTQILGLCVTRSGSHLKRKLGLSDTVTASCLHPQLDLSNMSASLFRISCPRETRLVSSSIFICQNENETDTNGHKIEVRVDSGTPSSQNIPLRAAGRKQTGACVSCRTRAHR